MAHYKKLVGNKVYLSPISPDDLDLYMQWANDDEVTQYFGIDSQIMSITQEKEFIEKAMKSGNNFSIVDLETNKLIGNSNFHAEDLKNRRVQLGIMIGDKNYWSRGYGSDALQLMLNFGFNVRNYNNIALYVSANNPRGLACYEKVGFKKQGVKREAEIRGNKKYDLYYMDILASEYFS